MMNNRRMVRDVSRVDRERIQQGLPPSWQLNAQAGHHSVLQAAKAARQLQAKNTAAPGRKAQGPHGDDSRFFEDLPPHWVGKNQ